MPKRVTLADIAARAGVTTATVSYAMRNHPKISVAMRDKIRAIASELGYRRDPALEILAAHRWHNRRTQAGIPVAYLAPPMREWSSFQSACFQGVREQAIELGYSLDHFCPDPGASPGQATRILYHRGVQGVIIRRLNRADELRDADWSPFSVVACGLGYYRPPLHTVMSNHHQNLKTVWEKLATAGFRRIGLAVAEKSPLTELPELFLGGFYFLQQALHTSVRIPVLRADALSPTAFSKWVRRHQPEVIIGCTDEVYHRATEAGFAIPSDFAFVSLERIHPLDPADKIAGLDLRPTLLGRMTMDLLDLQIKRNHRGFPDTPQTHLADAAWHPGKSLPGVP